jgi:hypothetical protein
MNKLPRSCLAVVASLGLFACAGPRPSSAPATSVLDESAWRPCDKTQLSFEGAPAAARATGSRREEPATALSPNRHEVVRGRLYSSR